MLVILIFLRTRIRIAIELINESSRAVGNMPFTLLWPLWPFIFEIALFGFWGANVIFLASVGQASYGFANSSLENLTSDLANSSNVVESTLYDAVNAACNDNGTASRFCNFIAYGGDEYTIYMQVWLRKEKMIDRAIDFRVR